MTKTTNAITWIGGISLLVALGIAGAILFYYDGDRVVPFSLLTGFVVMLVAQLRSLQASADTDQKVEVVHGIVNSQRTAMLTEIDKQVLAINDLKIELAKVHDSLTRVQAQSDIKTGTIDTQASQLREQGSP